jgi:hypothetical protein
MDRSSVLTRPDNSNSRFWGRSFQLQHLAVGDVLICSCGPEPPFQKVSGSVSTLLPTNCFCFLDNLDLSKIVLLSLNILALAKSAGPL